MSSLQHQAENHFRLTLCKVLDMSLLDAPSLFTFSNKPVFDEVRPLTSDVSSAFEDESMLTFDVSSVFEDMSLLTFDVSSAFEDVSSAFEDVSLVFEDVSLLTSDLSARISLSCPFIIPSNSCRSLSMVLSRGAAASGSGLVSIRRPIPCGFEGTG
jgi:hypothetical protein